MTVKRLIKILRKCPYKDAAVLIIPVDGREYGVCDLDDDGVKLVRYSRDVIPDVHTSQNAGEHEINEKGSFIGLLLSRDW